MKLSFSVDVALDCGAKLVNDVLVLPTVNSVGMHPKARVERGVWATAFQRFDASVEKWLRKHGIPFERV